MEPILATLATPAFWAGFAAGVLLLLGGFGALLAIGLADEREDPAPRLSPRQQQAAKHGKAVRS